MTHAGTRFFTRTSAITTMETHSSGTFRRSDGRRNLPDRYRTRLTLPAGADTQAAITCCFDRGTAHDTTHGEQVTVDFEARPEVVAQSVADAG